MIPQLTSLSGSSSELKTKLDDLWVLREDLAFEPDRLGLGHELDLFRVAPGQQHDLYDDRDSDYTCSPCH